MPAQVTSAQTEKVDVSRKKKVKKTIPSDVIVPESGSIQEFVVTTVLTGDLEYRAVQIPEEIAKPIEISQVELPSTIIKTMPGSTKDVEEKEVIKKKKVTKKTPLEITEASPESAENVEMVKPTEEIELDFTSQVTLAQPEKVDVIKKRVKKTIAGEVVEASPESISVQEVMTTALAEESESSEASSEFAQEVEDVVKPLERVDLNLSSSMTTIQADSSALNEKKDVIKQKRVIKRTTSGLRSHDAEQLEQIVKPSTTEKSQEIQRPHQPETESTEIIMMSEVHEIKLKKLKKKSQEMSSIELEIRPDISIQESPSQELDHKRRLKSDDDLLIPSGSLQSMIDDHSLSDSEDDHHANLTAAFRTKSKSLTLDLIVERDFIMTLKQDTIDTETTEFNIPQTASTIEPPIESIHIPVEDRPPTDIFEIIPLMTPQLDQPIISESSTIFHQNHPQPSEYDSMPAGESSSFLILIRRGSTPIRFESKTDIILSSSGRSSPDIPHDEIGSDSNRLVPDDHVETGQKKIVVEEQKEETTPTPW